MNRRSFALAIAALSSPLAGIAAASAQSAAPTKDEIIDALGGKGGTDERGFVQVSPGAVAKPRAGSTVASYGGVSAVHRSIGVPILFDLNSALIKPESRSALTTVAEALESPALKDAKILLEGHTDASGQAESNVELSRQRAAAVRDFLVAEGGVPANRLSTIGKGQSDPANPTDPLAPENRRVVLVNLSN